MKKLIVCALLALASSLTADRAFAENPQIRINIPFDFTVWHSTLPSGNYRIAYDHSGIATIANPDRGVTVVHLASNELPSSDETCKAVFDHYGEQYFLKQVSCNAANVNFAMPPSALQKKALEQAVINAVAAQSVSASRSR